MTQIDLNNGIEDRPIKVLVVDDEQDVLMMLKDFFDNKGFVASIAKNGTEAVELIEKDWFDIVISDIQMPLMDGMELLQFILDNHPTIDVIIMTGYTQIHTISEVIKAGAIDYLSKPFQLDELEGKIKRVLREKKCIGELEKEVESHNRSKGKISEQKEFLLTVLDAMTHPFYVIDIDTYTIELANKASGFNELNAQTFCYKLTHHRDTPCGGDEHPCPALEIKKHKKPLVVEHIHFDASGNERICAVHAYPIFGKDGRVTKMIEYSLDITERRGAEEQLKQSEEKYREFIESTDDLITQVDDQGNFTFINHMATEIFGISPKDCIGKSAGLFVHPEDQEATNEWFQECIKYRRVNATIENRQFNQSTKQHRHLLWTCTFHYHSDGELRTVNSIARDISKHIQTELALKKSTAEAEKASHLKSEFLANMSHEIRTPMNAIIGMNQLALKKEIPSEVRQFLEIVAQSSSSLMTVLNDILDFSKIEDGQLDIVERPFIFKSFIDSLVATFSANAIKKGNTISVELDRNLPLSLNGDDHRLRQILANIMGNAIKFTENGQVKVMVTIEEETEDAILLKFGVSDTGIGMSEDQQKTVFDIFNQADSTISRKYGGTGLGMAISQRLTALLGGSIWIESHLGEGSTFYFTAKFSKISKEMEINFLEDANSTEQQSGPFSILVVDDNNFNLKLATIVLEQDGHSVQNARNGLEALHMLNDADTMFDIVLMDVQMPIVDGIEATKLIRLCEEGRANRANKHQELLVALQEKIKECHLPIIAMTAHAMKGDRERCIQAGMDEYVTKPFEPADVFKVFRKVTSSPDGQDLPTDREDSKRRDSEENSAELVELNDVREHLIKVYDIAPENIDHMLQILMDTLTLELDKAGEYLAKGDLTSLSKSAHCMKGALSNAGLDKWSNLALRIEKQNVRDSEDLNTSLAELLNYLTKGLSRLTNEKS
jgi:PAS domain S-box-containing protein